MPKVSIIMPVYNASKYVNIAIRSVLSQSFKDFELLIYDDGSSDNSIEIINKFNDKRISVIKSRYNRGLVKLLNNGIERAKGEYIARMDADDISSPNRLKKQVDYLDKYKSIALVGTFSRIIDESGRIIGTLPKPVGFETIRKTCLYYGPHIHPTIMFRKNIIKKIGCYRNEYLFTEDIDLYFRLIFSGYKTNNIPEYLLKYRVHPNSTNIHFKEKNWKSFKLKWEMKKKYSLKFSLVEIISIYVHFLLGLILTFKQKSKVELFIKGVLDRILLIITQ